MDEQEASMRPAPQRQNQLAIPIAIVIGFGLIAAAIFFSGTNGIPGLDALTRTDNQELEQQTPNGEMRPIDENDHIRGNPNAPIMLVEYSDYDCPFCKQFHDTMKQVMNNYGSDGKVAWVYRHFPIQQLHPNAPRIAQASECVAELGGNEAFWTFSDLVFSERGATEQTNIARLPEFAQQAGVDEDAYKACMADNHTQALVEEDFVDGQNAGASSGTPHTIVIAGNSQGAISGAQSYEYVSSVIDTLLSQMEGGATETTTQE